MFSRTYALFPERLCCEHRPLRSSHFSFTLCMCMRVEGGGWRGANKCNPESVDGSNTLGQSVSIKWKKKSSVLAVKGCQLKLKLIGKSSVKRKKKIHCNREINPSAALISNIVYVPVHIHSIQAKCMHSHALCAFSKNIVK